MRICESIFVERIYCSFRIWCMYNTLFNLSGAISLDKGTNNMVENIDIGNDKDVIKEIRENIKKNPKYINPCSKEFQEDIKRYKFENGNKFISWMQQNGILPNYIEIDRRHLDNLARKKRLKNRAEEIRKWRLNKEKKDGSPISEQGQKKKEKKNSSIDPRYHPCSREFQEYAKRLGLTGYQYTQRLIEEEKLPDTTKIERENKRRLAQEKGYKSYKEYVDDLARKRGYENDAEYRREENWNRGYYTPMSENVECSSYIAVHIAERKIAKRILLMIFECIEDMPYGNRGFDFICKNPKLEFISKDPIFKLSINKCYKIDIKSSRLCHNDQWIFQIKYNQIADYFLLIGFNNEYDESKLKPMHTWLFKKDELIRNRKFYIREGFGIVNKIRYLSELCIYELKDELERTREHGKCDT